MKITTKVVWKMNTWEVLKEDSYEYDGPIAKCEDVGDVIEDVGDFITEDIWEDPWEQVPGALGALTTGWYAPLGAAVGTGVGQMFGIGGKGGSIAEMLGFGPSEASLPPAPAPNASVQEHTKYQEAVMDYQLHNQGLRRIDKGDGRFSIEEIPEDLLAAHVGERRSEEILSSREINKLFSERLTGALEGTLSDPSFERGVEEQRRKLTAEIERGQGLESTIGSRKLAEFEQRVKESRSSIGRAEISGLAGEERIRGGSTQSLVDRLLASALSGKQFEAGLGFQYAQMGQERDLAKYLADIGLQTGKQEMWGNITGAGISTIPGILAYI